MLKKTKSLNWNTHISVVFGSVVAIFGMIQLSSCQEDEIALPITIEFSAATQSAIEGNDILISVVLSKVPKRDGEIILTLGGDATYGEDYFTTPAGDLNKINIPIHRGEASLNFTVSTLGNNIREGDKEVIFSFASISDGFVIGQQKTLLLSILDDEDVAIAEFSTTSGNVIENSPVGITVDIPFSLPTKGSGSLTVSVASNNATNNLNFTTIPAINNGVILLNVEDNTNRTSITIVPIDDSFFHADYSILFELTSGTGSVKVGNNKVFSVFINEDESPALANLQTPSFSIIENNSTGTVVEIPLSMPASETGTVTVSVNSNSAIYGTHYTTIPAASGGNIFIDVAKGASKIEFTILPIDDLVDNENREIIFTLTNAVGAIRLGTSLSYSLTVLDDEPTLRKILISFGRSTGPLITGSETWNHAYDDFPESGDTWLNLVRSDGVATEIGILINTYLTSQAMGKVTGTNSGTFPDNALKDYWYVPGPNQGITRGFSITQLDNSIPYSFKIIGGTTLVSSDGRNTMTVSVDGEQKSILDVTNNVNNPLLWMDKTPSASIITINLTDTDGGGICPISAMEISWYED